MHNAARHAVRVSTKKASTDALILLPKDAIIPLKSKTAASVRTNVLGRVVRSGLRRRAAHERALRLERLRAHKLR